jgi:hypothetical protein
LNGGIRDMPAELGGLHTFVHTHANIHTHANAHTSISIQVLATLPRRWLA